MLAKLTFQNSLPRSGCDISATKNLCRRHPTACASTHDISRRTTLSLAAALLSVQFFPQKLHARPKPKAPLSTSLVPIVRVRDALGQLSEDVSSGTNGDLRRIVRVVLKGNDLVGSARAAGLWIPKSTAKEGERHAQEAYEYLDQIVDYFDATATKQRPQSEQLRFCLMAVDAASKELDGFLALFDADVIAQARAALSSPVA